MRSAAVVALLLALLGLAGHASAASFVVRVPTVDFDVAPYSAPYLFAGPVLAGDRVAWATVSRLRTVSVSTANSTGAVRETGRFNEPRTFEGMRLAGSEGRVALVTDGWNHERGYEELVFTTLRLGPVDGPLSELVACRPYHCGYCSGVGVGLGHDTTAVFEPRFGDRGSCRTEITLSGTASDGSPLERHYTQPGGYRAFRDPWLLFSTPDGAAFDVLDWRTGATLYSVPRRLTDPPSLDDDGAALYTIQEQPSYRSRLELATPDGKVTRLPITGHILSHTAGGGTLAFTTGHRIGIVSRTGRVLREARTPPLFGAMDVDSSRLVWSSRPCARVDVAVWDLRTAPPQIPERCSLPALRRGMKGTLSDFPDGIGSDFEIPVHCRVSSAQGCAGRYEVFIREGRRWALEGSVPYLVSPGVTGPAGGDIGYIEPQERRHRFAALLRFRARGRPGHHDVRAVMRDRRR